MDKNEIRKKIAELKEQRDAIIVAHNYQIDEIQEISDVIGDSLTLSRYCAENTKKLLYFAVCILWLKVLKYCHLKNSVAA